MSGSPHDPDRPTRTPLTPPAAKPSPAEAIERATSSRLLLVRLLARLALALDAGVPPIWRGVRRRAARHRGTRRGEARSSEDVVRHHVARHLGVPGAEARLTNHPTPGRPALFDVEEVSDTAPTQTPPVVPTTAQAPRLHDHLGVATGVEAPAGPAAGARFVAAFRDLVPSYMAPILAASLVTALLGSAVALGMVPGHGSAGSANGSAYAVSATQRPPGLRPTREAPLHVVLAPPAIDTDTAPLPPPSPPAALPPPPPTSVLIWPVHGPVAQEFGHNGHPGIDIDAPPGTPIQASGTGTVIWAGWQGGYGNFVLIDHGFGIVTGYAHQSRIIVSQGQHVNQGQIIGYEGSTGDSTGPHVHFEVRVNNVPHNPRLYVPGTP